MKNITTELKLHCTLFSNKMNKLKLIFSHSLILLLSINLLDFIQCAPHSNNFTICNSENCKKAAAYILEGLDKDQNPCENFYKFVCGKWHVNNPLPEGKNHWSRVTTAQQKIQKILINLLKSDDEINATRPVMLMREYYKDCMDLDTLEEIGIEPLDSIMIKLGDWPILMNKDVDRLSADWQEIDRHYMQIIGSYALFQIYVKADFDERSVNRIQIDSPAFPRTDAFPLTTRWTEYSKNISANMPYRQFMTEIVKLFFQHRNQAYSEERMSKDIEDILQFEYELYQAQIDSVDVENDRPTIEELQVYYNNSLSDEPNPSVNYDWFKSIIDLFEPTNFSIDSRERVLTLKWKYIGKLAQLLDKTNNRIIVNFVHWNFIATMIPFTNERTRELLFDVYGEGFIKNRFARELECFIECRLIHALYFEYAKKYFPKEAKINAFRMSEIIRKKALEKIENTSWLNQAMKSTFHDKIQSIHIAIGYPDWYSDKNLTNYYKDLEPATTYFAKIINFMKFARLKNLQEFRKPMIKFPWVLQPVAVNARYGYYYNAIVFPMVYVLSPNFAEELPLSVKYGFDGFVFAHEIFHAVDLHGVNYDKNWKKLNWSEEQMKSYQEKIDCLTDEFDRLLLREIDPLSGDSIWIQINGTLSAKENFVDTVGIRLAFESFIEMHSEGDQQNLRLPGLENYTSDQLFFISFASRWCRIGTIDWWQRTYGKEYYDEGHSPPQPRVNVALRNSQVFSQIFNCKKNNTTFRTCSI